MRRIAVINQKGGVGKTTTAVNLGAALARSGERVLLIDLDPQAHLGLHLGVEVDDEQATVYDVLTDEMPLADVIVKAGQNLDLAPSSIDLAAAESELVSVLGREGLLRDAIEPLDANYDYVLIDCPPSLGVLTINALVAARELVIPLQAQFFALQGFSKLLDKTVRLVCQRINPALEVLGVALCMHETNTRLSAEVTDDIKSFLAASRNTPVAWANARVFDTFVRRNIKLAEASSFGQSVFDYAPKSNGAIDYENLAAEIFGDGVAPKSTQVAAAGDRTDEPAETTKIAGEAPRAEPVPVAADPEASAPVAATVRPRATEVEKDKVKQVDIVGKSKSNGSATTTSTSMKRKTTKKKAAAPDSDKLPARRVRMATVAKAVVTESKEETPLSTVTTNAAVRTEEVPDAAMNAAEAVAVPSDAPGGGA